MRNRNKECFSEPVVSKNIESVRHTLGTFDPSTFSSPPPQIQSPFKSVEEKFAECLQGGEVVDLEKLKKLTWNGIPSKFRALCWKILMVKYKLAQFTLIPF